MRRDALVCVVILAAGVWWGATFERAWHAAGYPAQFYQRYFEPAVMIACGHGFTVATQPSAALRRFLAQETPSLDCGEIAPGLVPTTDGIYQYGWYFLMRAVGITWWIFGVSWAALAPLFGVLCGAVLALSYALFRFGMGPGLALAGTAAIAVSTTHLVNLPHLRDYAKAPFVLAVVVIMAAVVRLGTTRARLLAAAGAGGAVLGVGYGVRTDLLACIPPLLVTLAIFPPGGVTRRLVEKAQAVAACLLVFVAMAWTPIRYVTTSGGCQWHVMLLGFSSAFDPALGIAPASYDWGPYSDPFIHTIVGTHARPKTGTKDGLSFCGPDYDRATGAYLRAMVTNFPGDVATRALAAMSAIADLPYEWRAAPLPAYDNAFYRWRADVLSALFGWGPMLAALFLVWVAAADLRAGLWTLLLLLWFGGLPMLQFSNRHYFHLEWIGWLALGTLVSAAARGVAWVALRSKARSNDSASRIDAVPWRVAVRNVLVLAACCAAVFVAALVARNVQTTNVRGLVRSIAAWTSEPLPASESGEAGRVVLTPSLEGTPETRPRFWVEYLRIDVDPAACGAGPVTVRYAPPHEGLSRDWIVEAGQSAILTPVFQSFRDVLTSTGCVRGLFRAADLKPFPLWMFVSAFTDDERLRAVQSYAGR